MAWVWADISDFLTMTSIPGCQFSLLASWCRYRRVQSLLQCRLYIGWEVLNPLLPNYSWSLQDYRVERWHFIGMSSTLKYQQMLHTSHQMCLTSFGIFMCSHWSTGTETAKPCSFELTWIVLRRFVQILPWRTAPNAWNQSRVTPVSTLVSSFPSGCSITECWITPTTNFGWIG